MNREVDPSSTASGSPHLSYVSILAAIGVGLGVLALAAVRTLRLDAMAPADALFAVRAEDSTAVWAVRGPIANWLIETLEIWTWPLRDQRAAVFVVIATGIVLLGLALRRCRRFPFEAACAILAVFGLWPWFVDDAVGLSRFGDAFVPLLLGGALLIAGNAPLALLGAVLFGALEACTVGDAWPVGPPLLFGGLLLLARRGVGTAVFGAVVWAATAFGLACMLGASVAVLPRVDWWVDVGLSAALDPWWASTAVLAVLALLSVVASLGESKRNATMLLAFIAAGLGLGWAALQVRRLTGRQVALARDVPSLESALAKVNTDVGEVFLLNVPLHVRPYLLGLLGHAPRGRVSLLRTWDTGAQLFLPEEWYGIWEGAPVIRWTKRGFQVTTWARCLELEPFPLVRATSAGDPVFAAHPFAMLGLGRLPATVAGVSAEAGKGGRVELESDLAAPIECAVAIGGARRTALAVPAFLTQSLSAGWFGPPYPHTVCSGSARQTGYEAGFGPTLHLAAGKHQSEVRPTGRP